MTSPRCGVADISRPKTEEQGSFYRISQNSLHRRRHRRFVVGARPWIKRRITYLWVSVCIHPLNLPYKQVVAVFYSISISISSVITDNSALEYQTSRIGYKTKQLSRPQFGELVSASGRTGNGAGHADGIRRVGQVWQFKVRASVYTGCGYYRRFRFSLPRRQVELTPRGRRRRRFHSIPFQSPLFLPAIPLMVPETSSHTPTTPTKWDTTGETFTLTMTRPGRGMRLKEVNVLEIPGLCWFN